VPAEGAVDALRLVDLITGVAKAVLLGRVLDGGTSPRRFRCGSDGDCDAGHLLFSRGCRLSKLLRRHQRATSGMCVITLFSGHAALGMILRAPTLSSAGCI
jgi:hypothetical protein